MRKRSRAAPMMPRERVSDAHRRSFLRRIAFSSLAVRYVIFFSVSFDGAAVHADSALKRAHPRFTF
jgi:hypothetical protein